MSRPLVFVFMLLIFPTLAKAQEIPSTSRTVHVVVKGETLWELAGRYYGNPFRWPLIFEANRDRISDPDLIEIGWSLSISGVTAIAQDDHLQAIPSGARPLADPGPPRAVVGAARVRGAEPDSGALGSVPSRFGAERAAPGTRERPASREAAKQFAVPHGFVYRAEWIDPAEAEGPQEGTVEEVLDEAGAPGLPGVVGQGTMVLVSLSAGAGMRPGDLLQTFRRHWSDRRVGTAYRPSGVLVVVAANNDGVRARVSSQFERIRIGDRVRRAPDYNPTPLVFPSPVRSQSGAVVLGFPEDRPFHGLGARVFLSLTDGEEFSIGDVFGARVGTPGPTFGKESARLQVVRIYGNRATARIVGISEPGLQVGDPLRLVAKMR
jgi:hypothetical protein